MRISRKDLSMLSVKGLGIHSMGDPKAIRDNCSVCGKWKEDLNPKTRRCGEEECEKMLAEKALSMGMAVRIGDTIVGNLSAAVPHVLPAGGSPAKRLPRSDPDMCGCGKEMKRIGDDRCIRCRLKANSKKFSKNRK